MYALNLTHLPKQWQVHLHYSFSSIHSVICLRTASVAKQGSHSLHANTSLFGSMSSCNNYICLLTAKQGEQAFHVVVPSLPGFGFSSAPTKAGFGVAEAARTFNELMLSLGYTQYMAQGDVTYFNELK
jgi:hypothetical protein